MPGMVKKERERERSHVGHACQPSIRIVMPGMKMNEISCRKERKNSANQFLFKEFPLALENKRMIIIINILSDKVHARYKVLCNRYTN